MNFLIPTCQGKIMTPEHSKAESERIHLRRRSLERLGKRLSRAKIKTVTQKLHEKDPAQVKLLWQTSLTRKVYAVKLDGRWLPVAYSKKTKQPITVLPLEVLDEYQDLLEETI